jgi:adenosine 3'-phospho 5'-phosphosulfate transporter B2
MFLKRELQFEISIFAILLLSFSYFALHYSNFDDRRRLEEDPENLTDSDVAVEKTMRYLLFFTLLGFCMFYGQKVVNDRNKSGPWITWFRNTTIIALCCRVPSRKRASAEEAETEQLKSSSKPSPRARAASSKDDDDFDVKLLLFCVLGLVGSYLAWGYFQERIMTRSYTSLSTGSEDKFKDAEFLVFCNRIAGLVIGRIGMEMTGPHDNFAPPFSFSFCSMSNILSSWFQYEALKFITFPMQVLSKSCKIIAAMLMGKFLNGSTFTNMEVFNAVVITAGLFVYKFGQSQGHTDDEEMSDYFMLGMFLITCYIMADSFTSNWQQKIYSQYPIHSFQMMVGVNMFSATISLCLCAPKFWTVKAFCEDHPLVLMHMVLMSSCSAFGQLFIFYTIKKFGAVVFATAMTSRSILSVLISISIFGHTITPIGAFGLCISFSGLIWKVWLKRQKTLKKKAEKAAERARQRELEMSRMEKQHQEVDVKM